MTKSTKAIAMAQAAARAPYADKIRKMTAAIKALMIIVEADRRELLTSDCLLNADLSPRLETISEVGRSHLEEFDEAIRLGKEALQ